MQKIAIAGGVLGPPNSERVKIWPVGGWPLILQHLTRGAAVAALTSNPFCKPGPICSAPKAADLQMLGVKRCPNIVHTPKIDVGTGEGSRPRYMREGKGTLISAAGTRTDRSAIANSIMIFHSLRFARVGFHFTSRALWRSATLLVEIERLQLFDAALIDNFRWEKCCALSGVSSFSCAKR